ncbi:hypothetical protein KCU92_g10171, partial [Aureobasidium melanogenum]|jgi:hypothetical protein
MFSYTSIPDLETLLRKGTVRRPVDGFFIKRNYTDRELDTLKSLEPDASKAVGRQLSNTERNVLLEYKGNSMASISRTEAFAVSIGALGGLISTMYATRARRRWICGHYAHWMWHFSVRTLISTAIATVPATIQIVYTEERQPLSIRILSDARMSQFKESIRRREMEFDGHKPEIVRRKDRNIEPPIQWFTDAYKPFVISPVSESPAIGRIRHDNMKVQQKWLPITDYPDHPELSWPEGSSYLKKRLRDNLLARKSEMTSHEAAEDQARAPPMFACTDPPVLIPRLYVE